MSFSSLRCGQFCDFRPKVCFSASGSKVKCHFRPKGLFSRIWIQRFEILPFSSSSLTPSSFFS
ncbi:hypothetical protein HanXRQr2_Chr10g0458661 [Helianthus annuus]|uniref:Uncharacterized protein n=1 Tax=Helianthus annuus TaxID=4232 RepID=A0A9K3N5X4_HELAN|nr:hypothetical protein HanXRQr2_Chr10g0458661 [Helianthus annuus]